MHAMIVCPSDRGLLHFETVASIYDIQQLLLRSGHSYEFSVTAFTEIVAARNQAATRFLDSGADMLIGIDDDNGVSEEAFSVMLDADVGFIGVCSPQRVMDLDKYAEGVRKGFSNLDAQRYAAPLVNGPGTPEGISEIDGVGGGFFILRRAPLKALVDRGLVSRRTEASSQGESETYDFYDLTMDETGRELAEDLSFCKRLRDAGFTIYIYKGPGVDHSGEATFHS